ncbi:MAG: hypothetical protein R6X18_03230 [Chloroflexota bacterium]
MAGPSLILNRHSIIKLLFLLITISTTIMLLAACADNAGVSNEGVVATVPATADGVVEAETNIPPAETATDSPEPAATATPLPAVEATEPPTPTPAPTEVPAEPEEDNNIEQGIAAILALGYEPRVHARYPSPEGSTEAQVLIYDCTTIIEGQENALDVLRIVDSNSGEIVQEVTSQFQYCGGLGAFGLGGLYWSPSGRFFYYTNSREGLPDGCGFWTRPVSRVDTTDWSIEELGGVALSQGGDKLAGWDGPELVMWDVDGKETGRIEVAREDAAKGPIVWSPGDEYVAYLLAKQFCVPDTDNESTVVIVDVSDMSEEVLLTSDSPAHQDIAWYGPEQLILADGLGGRWFLDVATGEVNERP